MKTRNENNHDNFVTSTNTTTTTTTTGSTGGTSTGTGARARARAREATPEVKAGWYKDCCLYYADSFRREPAPGIRREIAEAIRGGMTGECLMAIMDETMSAPRPSWAYCRAIMARCAADGIETLEDWNRDRQQRSQSRNPALNYDQRRYPDDDFGPDFFVDLSAYGQ